MDFAGPFEGHIYLVVVDAHSKWPKVHIMDSTVAGKTIQVLQDLFSRLGIPHVLVSDNGPQFCSEQIRVFLESNTSAPRRTILPLMVWLSFCADIQAYIESFQGYCTCATTS